MITDLEPIIRRAKDAIMRREPIVLRTAADLERFNLPFTRRAFILGVADEFAKRYDKWRKYETALNNAY